MSFYQNHDKQRVWFSFVPGEPCTSVVTAFGRYILRANFQRQNANNLLIVGKTDETTMSILQFSVLRLAVQLVQGSPYLALL
ncbi:MAG TPA: hypothetical protein ENG03_02660 [Thioploca sp.]|nr:hypothetical protein [Thioploca sp.]